MLMTFISLLKTLLLVTYQLGSSSSQGILTFVPRLSAAVKLLNRELLKSGISTRLKIDI